MTLDYLYGELKEAAKYLGPGFQGFEDITVTLVEGKLVLSYEDKEARIKLLEGGEA